MARSWLKTGLWILDLNPSSVTCSLTLEDFSFVPRFPHLQGGDCSLSYLIGLLWRWPNVYQVFRRACGSEHVLCQCWLLRSLLPWPARISLMLSLSCLSWLLKGKVTQLSCDILPIFSTKIDFLPPRICVYLEDHESDSVPLSDRQEDKQKFFVLRRQCKKVISLSLFSDADGGPGVGG